MSDKLAIHGENSPLRLQVNWRESFRASAKLLVDFYFKNQNNIGVDAADLLASLGLDRKITPESLAGVLINRALIKAIADIISTYCEEWKQLTAAERERLNEHLLSQIPIDSSELEIDRYIFEQPQVFRGLAEAQSWMELWLQDLVENTAAAQAMSARLPSYFTCALHDELQKNRDKYQPLTTHFADTLASEAYQREIGWRQYTAWLDKQLDEPIFAETFGIRPLYVPLCAYYIEKQGDDREGSSQTREIRHARDLESEMDAWLLDPKSACIRLISGGPGSGKSTFTKWWAARVVAQGNFKVWHIALNHLNLIGDLEGRLKDFAAKNLYLRGNPLDEQRILIIFDGLDELALSGKVGLAAAENFVEQLNTLVNASQKDLKVLVSGRDAIVQSQINKFSKPDQIWHLLPYYLSEDRAKAYQAYPQNLLATDRRHDWWRKYGGLKGKKCEGLPKSLRIESLDEITSQPILNYLVAISDYFLQNKIDESTTRNQIYQSLLEKVYERGWAERNKATGDRGHPITKSMSFADFQLVLEEVALCAWHGDGRKVSEAEIIAHCENSGKKIKGLLSYFSENIDSAQSRITKLLTAFYFQARGEDLASGDKTFEFTHKSFGEFLVAKRLVRAIEEINEEYRDERRGWNEKQSLKHWVEVCKSGTLDFDVLEFFRQEVRLRYQDRPELIGQWQETCCKLIEYLLREGLPMEEFGGLSFHQMNNRAIQAEIMLLASLNACAICTEQLSTIEWGDRKTFGTWLAKMQGQQNYEDRSIVSVCLSWLNLDGVILDGVILDGASLDGASLLEASLDGASLDEASLLEARLDRASLSRAHLDGAHLDGAHLDGASLYDASLSWARLDGASLLEARLDGASLDWVCLDGASLDGANLLNISWNEKTIWENVQGLESARNIPKKLKQQLGLG
jgi:Pentapeptide repeats (8 copies)